MYLAEMEKGPEVARRFTRMLYGIHQPPAEELAESLDHGAQTKLVWVVRLFPLSHHLAPIFCSC